MTTEQKIIKTKVGVLELAKQLGNVSKACQLMGYSREPRPSRGDRGAVLLGVSFLQPF